MEKIPISTPLITSQTKLVLPFQYSTTSETQTKITQRMKTMIREWIKLQLLLVFLGITMIWIMTPTKTHKQIWVPKIRARANTTYFGSQGANLLEYTFPMLFLAALGCVYLHLGKKPADNNHIPSSDENKSRPSLWKRPALVKGPLGVVSWTEFAFVLMFISLLIWSFGTYLQIRFSAITHEDGEEVWEARLEKSALVLALVGNIVLSFLFLPVTRMSSVLPLLGLTSESSIKYHIWFGHITMTLFTSHGLCYLIYWASTKQLSEMNNSSAQKISHGNTVTLVSFSYCQTLRNLKVGIHLGRGRWILISMTMLKWENTGVSNIAGELALLSGLAMWTTTFPKIRRKMFELFFYTHYLYILFVIFFMYHVGVAYSGIMLPGLYLFVIDRYLRFLQSRQNVRVLSARILPCDTLELNFFKSTALSYGTASILFINVPSISKLQWHPFTVTSSSNLEPEKLSIMIKKEGSWSQKLYQMLAAPMPVERLAVAVEGPYGPVSTHFLRHETLVMVSGGSGITPFFSIIRELIFMSTTEKRKTPQILLVCAFKNSVDLTMLDLILPISGSPTDFSRLQLQIEAYVTRDKQNTMTVDNKDLIQTTWFKPKASDQPISAILGSNNWLWLGAIISSSFVMYLILLGIVVRYYIYPIDHNTNKIYSSAARSTISMLLICMCIAITSTLVVLKNKKRYAMEAKKIQITDTHTPTASPGSWFHNTDRELESVPNQSILQATNIHYGSRPNLKKILLEREGSSVGVYVSGPKQMRHDVATICSSGLADHLQYESMSFNW